MRSKAQKATSWRESLPSSATERQRWYAHRAGAQIAVAKAWAESEADRIARGAE
jgi:hypothetical protein